MYPSALQLSPFSNTLIQCVIRVHRWNGFADVVETAKENPVLSLAEYRKLFNDQTSTDELARERINFLVRYTRKNIKNALKKICQK